MLTPTDDTRIVNVTPEIYLLQRRCLKNNNEVWQTIGQFLTERHAHEAQLQIRGGSHGIAD